MNLYLVVLDMPRVGEPDVALVWATSEDEAKKTASKGPGVKNRKAWREAMICQEVVAPEKAKILTQYEARHLPGNKRDTE